MKASEYDRLVKAAASRALDPVEEDQVQRLFAANLCTQEDWELDVAVEKALMKLPQVPVASNFTARVLASVQLEQKHHNRTDSRWKGLFRWKWSPAMATLLVVGFIVAQNYRENALRAEVAQSIAAFKEVTAVLSEPPIPDDARYPVVTPPMPTFEVLQNFDSIKRLNMVTEKIDMDLLSALQ